MKQSRSRRPLALLYISAIAITAAPASAQGASPSDGISGTWKFRSFVFEDNCVMAGNISFRPAAQKNTFTCSFVVESNCRGPGQDVHEYWRVKQICAATLSGKRLQVTSKVASVEERRRFGQPVNPAQRQGYLPDNFDVLIEIPNVQMGGRIFDRIRRVPVRLWREEEHVS